ncbi:MAG: LysR family transcriptional [Rhodospirillaceae bacterium]|nr:MAG: LysR family transcriptional [Rhodospirillaceae bacterium]TNC95752.1 MAG: LysR family transcriptional regulator [Stygiobacter sp.]
MKALDLPVDLLRTFATVCRLGSVTRAAAVLGRTQPALSLQLRRLEHLVGRPVLRRQGRILVLTPLGEVLLDHAGRLLDAHDAALAALAAEPLSGRLRVGVIQDVADTALTQALARFSRRHGRVRLDVRVAGSQELRRLLAEGELEVAVCSAAAVDGDVTLPMEWFGSVDLLTAEPLPLALLDAPCPFRQAAIDALDRAGLPWRMAVSGSSLSGLRAAAAAGLAVTCRWRFGMVGVPPLAGLPDLPQAGLQVLQQGAQAAPLADLLRQEIVAL